MSGQQQRQLRIHDALRGLVVAQWASKYTAAFDRVERLCTKAGSVPAAYESHGLTDAVPCDATRQTDALASGFQFVVVHSIRRPRARACVRACVQGVFDVLRTVEYGNALRDYHITDTLTMNESDEQRQGKTRMLARLPYDACALH